MLSVTGEPATFTFADRGQTINVQQYTLDQIGDPSAQFCSVWVSSEGGIVFESGDPGAAVIGTLILRFREWPIAFRRLHIQNPPTNGNLNAGDWHLTGIVVGPPGPGTVKLQFIPAIFTGSSIQVRMGDYSNGLNAHMMNLLWMCQ